MEQNIKSSEEVRNENLIAYISKNVDAITIERMTDTRLYDEQKLDARDWVDALRSGQFNQAKGFLRVIEGVADPAEGSVAEIHNSYCCLGVLLDTMSDGWYDDNEDIVTWLEPEPNGDGGYYVMNENVHNINDDSSGTLINEDVAIEMGLFERTQEFLSGLNDNGATFAEIADIIEANDIGAILDLKTQLENLP
jgi:hypothetical protein